jgi:hypothetical protein
VYRLTALGKSPRQGGFERAPQLATAAALVLDTHVPVSAFLWQGTCGKARLGD